MHQIKSSILKKVFKKRSSDVHKYDFGHLLVIGGSKIYSGSPALAALAALRSGVDLVTVVAPQRAADIIASFSPDLITYPLEGDWLSRKHLGELYDLRDNKTAVVIGGGLCRATETLETVVEYLKNIDLPCVVDADAIYAVAKEGRLEQLSQPTRKKEPPVLALSSRTGGDPKGVAQSPRTLSSKKKLLLTPHLHEFFILSRHNIERADLKTRIKLVKDLAKKLKVIILLKAHIDIISDGTRVALNKTGNPYMTVGGTGDTLAGICGSFLAQGIDIFTSACAAAYLNGRAGDITALRLKEALTASDVIEAIPAVIK